MLHESVLHCCVGSKSDSRKMGSDATLGGDKRRSGVHFGPLRGMFDTSSNGFSRPRCINATVPLSVLDALTPLHPGYEAIASEKSDPLWLSPFPPLIGADYRVGAASNRAGGRNPSLVAHPDRGHGGVRIGGGGVQRGLEGSGRFLPMKGTGCCGFGVVAVGICGQLVLGAAGYGRGRDRQGDFHRHCCIMAAGAAEPVWRGLNMPGRMPRPTARPAHHPAPLSRATR